MGWFWFHRVTGWEVLFNQASSAAAQQGEQAEAA
jgi:hypothetical protein